MTLLIVEYWDQIWPPFRGKAEGILTLYRSCWNFWLILINYSSHFMFHFLGSQFVPWFGCPYPFTEERLRPGPPTKIQIFQQIQSMRDVNDWKIFETTFRKYVFRIILLLSKNLHFRSYLRLNLNVRGHFRSYLRHNLNYHHKSKRTILQILEKIFWSCNICK